MRTFLKFGMVLVIILLAGPVWSSEEQPDQVPPRWSSWFSAQGLQTIATPAQTPVYQANVTPTSYTPPVAPANVRDLSLEADRPRTQGMLASTTWLKGALATETEVANNQGEHNIPGDTQNDPAHRMMRLGLTASSDPAARYGITYRTAGQAYSNGPDQAQKEVWGEWKNGLTTLRSAIGQQHNNVDGDPTRARLEQNYGRVGLSWNNAAWDAGLTSSYILGADPLRNGSDNRIKMQTVTASVRPLNTLTIAPLLGYRTEQQDWSGVRIDSPSASLAMNYKQSQQLLISAIGNYSGIRSSDRLIDLENVGGKGILAWDIQESRGWTTRMSLEGGYNRQTNRVMSSAETQDISGLLRFVLAPF